MNKATNYPIKPHQYLPYLILFLICSLGFLFANLLFTSLFDLLSFNRSLIEDGQWWRIISGHLLHTNAVHLAVNLIGLALLWMLHGDYVRPLAFFWQFFVLCLGTSLFILFLSPNIQWYVGLSGVLHGMFVWGAMIDVQHKRKSGYLLLIGVAIKLIDEQFFADQSFMSNLIDANVAIDAHLYGAVVGLLLGALAVYKK